MSSVPLKHLKENLSAIIERVSQGEVISIFKYNKPIAKLIPAGASGLRVGTQVGKSPLKPARRGGTKGRSLDALQDDRDS